MDDIRTKRLLELLGLRNEDELLTIGNEIRSLQEARKKYVHTSFTQFVHETKHADETIPQTVRRLGLPRHCMDGSNFTGSLATVNARVDALVKAGTVTGEIDFYPEQEQARIGELLEHIASWKAGVSKEIIALEPRKILSRQSASR